MTIKQVITESVSATGASFLVDEFSVAGVLSVVPYTKLMGGQASSTSVAFVNTVGRLHVNAELTANAKVAISGTPSVVVSNASLAVTQSGAWNVSISGTASVIVGNAAAIGGGTQYAVDDALGATPTGTLNLGIRDDSLSALTPIEGDAVGLRVNSTGALWTQVNNTSLAVTQSGAWDVSLSGTADVSIVNALPAGTNSIGKVDISNTPSVVVSNATLAVTQSGAWDVSLSGTADVSLVNSLPAGTNSIGKVDISNTAAVTIQNTPSVIASHNSSAIYDGTTSLTPKFASYGINSSGATTIISKVAAKKLRILQMSLVSEGAAGAYFQDDDTNILAGTAADPMEFQAGGGMVLPYSPVGWFETTASAAFMIVPDTATSIAGSVVYVEV